MRRGCKVTPLAAWQGEALCSPGLPPMRRREGLGLRHLWGMAALGLLLAGCVVPGGGIRSVALLDGAVVAAAPAGYCIAPGAGQRGEDSAVVLMGRCSDRSEADPAVLTLSVGAAGSAGAMAAGGAALADFFRSGEGRAMLSRAGRAADVRVLEAVGRADAFFLHVEDAAVGDYWRALTGIRGRLVTVSVAGPEGQDLPEGKGRTLVEDAVAALRRANPAPASAPAAPPAG